MLLSSGAAFAGPASIDAQLFRPPATAGGILGLDDGAVGPHLSVAASLFVDYAHQPLVLEDAAGHRLG
ncbi:MAG: hypothetical protein LC659_04595, partial [Myxococcales bacterium]|nr:hypothetical protein [Myxococcales bacterium]